MADKKISQLTSLAQGDIATTTDVLAIVDTSATETKKATPAAIVGAAAAAGLTNVDINSGAIDGTTIGANSAAAGTFTTLTGSTKTVSPFFDAVGSAGGQLRNASGTSQLAWGAGGGSNLSLEVATNINPANANVSLAPTGTGTVTINPATAGTMNNVAIGGTTAAAGSFTTLTTSSTVTLNGGTANGVLYLNGSKVATSGTALVFDGTNLGIGVTPSYKLDVLGSGAAAAFRINNATAGKSAMLVQSNGATAGIIGLTGFVKGDSSTNLGFFAETGLDLRFYTNGSATEKAVIDTSGNLGIGTTSPATKLDVAGDVTVAGDGSTTFGTVNLIRKQVLSSGAGVGFLRFQGYSAGTTVQTGAQILCDIPATWTSTSTPANLLFYTTPSGSTTPLNRLTIDSSGNLGIGVTPSAWNSSYKALDIGNSLGIIGGASSADLYFNSFLNASSNFVYKQNATASAYSLSNGQHRWFTAPSGTAGNAISFTQAMTLDANTNLLCNGGTTGTLVSASRKGIEVNCAAGQESTFALNVNGALTAVAGIASASDFVVGSVANIPMIFRTNNTERARITAGGYFKASNAGTYQGSTLAYHELRTDAADYSTIVGNTNASPYGAYILFGSADPNNSTNLFLLCNGWNGSSLATRATIRSNGGLANYQSNNVDLSDARTKKDIAPAASMWDKIGALEIVTYKYNDQTHDDVNVGVIAQQVESVEPVWVDADGFGETPEGEEPLKTVYTKDITFAAIKALQEAMARIESLEVKVAALEAK